jgi:GT2 family glycosyltransferase
VKASFIIVNWNTRELASQAIASLQKNEKDQDREIIVVDNASSDGSAAHLRERFPGVTLIANSENVGFAKANNQGAAVAKGDWLILFNSDAYLTEPLLDPMLAAAEKVGKDCILTCQLKYQDGSTQLCAMPFPTLGGYLKEILFDTAAAHRRMLAEQEALQGDAIPVDWVTGAFLMAPRNLYLELGGLDPSIFMYAEDMDFCRKAAQKGVRCYLTKAVSAIHIGGASVDYLSARALRLTDDGRLAYFRRWHGRRGAFALRAIFMLRSLLRLALFGATGILRGDRRRLAKAGVHLKGLAFLLGGR